MDTTYKPETGEITVRISMSEADAMDAQGLSLYLTPGSSQPYKASHASFKYDRCVVTPSDVLEALGYDSFNDDHDYSGADDIAEIVVDYIDPTPYVG